MSQHRRTSPARSIVAVAAATLATATLVFTFVEGSGQADTVRQAPIRANVSAADIIPAPAPKPAVQPPAPKAVPAVPAHKAAAPKAQPKSHPAAVKAAPSQLPSCEEVPVGQPCTPADPTEGGRYPAPNGPAADTMAEDCLTDGVPPSQWQSAVVVHWNPDGSRASQDGPLADCVSITQYQGTVNVELLTPTDSSGQPSGELYFDTSNSPVFEEQPVGTAPQEGGRHAAYKQVTPKVISSTPDSGYYETVTVVYLQYSPCGSNSCD